MMVKEEPNDVLTFDIYEASAQSLDPDNKILEVYVLRQTLFLVTYIAFTSFAAVGRKLYI